MRCILDVDGIKTALLVRSFGYRRRHQRTYCSYWRGQSVDHVAPVRHHIECYASAFCALIIPAWSLACLGLSIENPGPSIDTEREYAAKEAGILDKEELGETWQK